MSVSIYLFHTKTKQNTLKQFYKIGIYQIPLLQKLAYKSFLNSFPTKSGVYLGQVYLTTLCGHRVLYSQNVCAGQILV
jgi:hypothetical protein